MASRTAEERENDLWDMEATLGKSLKEFRDANHAAWEARIPPPEEFAKLREKFKGAVPITECPPCPPELIEARDKAEDRLAIAADICLPKGFGEEGFPRTQEEAADMYERVSFMLNRLHSSAANFISRDDNNKMFEAYTEMRYIAARIRSGYGETPEE